ncbi:hypothetical protein ACH5RR_017135 [Cinchona calisaya]|uniref:Sec-independent protein translocase protein TATB, chloroplastic n=1 Tax=Cinchona calisaya TaxID=153742 RepID=A0ABD2ZXX6_9GENT
MASAAIFHPTSTFCLTSLSSSSATVRKHTFTCYLPTSSSISVAQDSDFKFSKWIPQLGLCQFPQWNGLKNHLGISLSSKHLVKLAERKGKCKGRGVYASLFGVGVPKALVIGVVALLVFGPKGLAEVARNLGKTLRAFQPTIRELQEVSREFKSTLEREIGLNEIQNSTQNASSSNSTKTTSSPAVDAGSVASQTEIDPNGNPPPSKAYSSEAFLKITEEQLKETAAKQNQQEESRSPGENQLESQCPAVQQQVDVASSGGSTEIETGSQD